MPCVGYVGGRGGFAFALDAVHQRARGEADGSDVAGQTILADHAQLGGGAAQGIAEVPGGHGWSSSGSTSSTCAAQMRMRSRDQSVRTTTTSSRAMMTAKAIMT